MGIKVICVGKLKEKYWRESVNEYKKRLTSYCKLEILELKESPIENVKDEGKLILSKINKDDFVITLEILGKELTSEELSLKIENLEIQGKSKIVFVIGGSCGLDDEVIKRSDFALSFSKMTFPHQMMRVFLLEQIYRSYKIMKNEKYHK